MRKMTMQEMMDKVASLEAELKKKKEPGRIWADISKASKEGAEPGPIVFRGVNSNPKFTINMYCTGYVRFREVIHELDSQVLMLAEKGKLAFRSPEERTDCLMRLSAVATHPVKS